MFECLPTEITNKLIKLKNVTEIRLRINENPIIYHQNGKTILSKIKIDSSCLQNIVSLACNRSIYGYDEYIKQGFITTKSGMRIGICGEVVYDNYGVTTIKNYSSLCIRVPNNVIDASSEFFNVYKGGSVLVISKTGVGKTTFLRDLTTKISKNFNDNVVVVDERNEIAAKTNVNSFYLGASVDVLTFANNTYGFTHAIRTLNPTYVVTDELITNADFQGVYNAVNSGVYVLASMHGNSNFVCNTVIKNFVKSKAFNYYVYLSIDNNERKTTVFNENLSKIYG